MPLGILAGNVPSRRPLQIFTCRTARSARNMRTTRAHFDLLQFESTLRTLRVYSTDKILLI